MFRRRPHPEKVLSNRRHANPGKPSTPRHKHQAQSAQSLCDVTRGKIHSYTSINSWYFLMSAVTLNTPLFVAIFLPCARSVCLGKRAPASASHTGAAFCFQAAATSPAVRGDAGSRYTRAPRSGWKGRGGGPYGWQINKTRENPISNTQKISSWKDFVRITVLGSQKRWPYIQNNSVAKCTTRYNQIE